MHTCRTGGLMVPCNAEPAANDSAPIALSERLSPHRQNWTNAHLMPHVKPWCCRKYVSSRLKQDSSRPATWLPYNSCAEHRATGLTNTVSAGTATANSASRVHPLLAPLAKPAGIPPYQQHPQADGGVGSANVTRSLLTCKRWRRWVAFRRSSTCSARTVCRPP